MAIQANIGEVVFNVGDKVRVFQKIQEGDKIRTQPFEGIVIAIRGHEENKTFTVRKIAAAGIGAERIWPVLSPWIEKIEVIKKGKVRRAKLYYLRHQPTEVKFLHEKKEPRRTRGKSRPSTTEEPGL